MKELERYDSSDIWNLYEGYCSLDNIESGGGDWCKSSDVEKLEKEIEVIKYENFTLEERNKEVEKYNSNLHKKMISFYNEMIDFFDDEGYGSQMQHLIECRDKLIEEYSKR